MHYERLRGSGVPVVFLHGWGHSMENLRPLAGQMSQADRWLLDLPGFGATPIPPEVMAVEDYARAVSGFIAAHGIDRPWLVGHSFGGKVAMELASAHPEMVRGIFVIGGAGLRTPKTKAKVAAMRAAHAAARLLRLTGTPWWRRLSGAAASDDYRNAAPVMREILKMSLKHRTLRKAKSLRVPATLIYGRLDTTTPPSFGKRFARAIKGSRLFVLEGFDHNSILGDGKYQVAGIIADALG
ncbi:alpha/beta hydrolase [Alphaproteobacteria bacterium]|nr:alpha/beta hydrolase [Alphaproteobacteria bacterium]